jgi:hypothetical protein
MEHNKQQGELAELQFYLKSHEYGFIVSKPFGDSAKYDFIVDCNGRLSRVQVKSTAHTPYRHTGYQITIGYGKDKTCYSKKDIDYLCAYIVPSDLWYIMPIKILGDKRSLSIYPKKPEHPINAYKESWQLFKKGRAVTSTKLEPNFSVVG